MTIESIRAAYGVRADEYIDAVGGIDHVDANDLALVETWARTIEGRLFDVGCGPGQWTHYLSGFGISTEGVDPVPEFVDRAQTTYPGERFRLGCAEDLGVDDGSLGGVFAWYSLIHTDPEHIGAPLTEFARCIRPSGGLMLGFFTGTTLESFEHAVITAYRWPVDLLASEVEASGFTVTHTETRRLAPARTHGAIVATR